MSIEFACPQCHRVYRVKDELAGKSAKCGLCGHKMAIPKPAPAAAVTPVPTAAHTPVAAEPVAKQVAKAAAPKSEPAISFDTAGANSDLGAFLAAELEAPELQKLADEAVCRSCGKSMPAGALICVSCGYDTRTGVKLETKREMDPGDEGKGKKRKKRSRSSFAGSLMLGSLCSFLGAMLGAIIWAVVAYLTGLQSGYIAIGLGALSGYGMALVHDDSDGTLAGIISAFMSLVGIIAAKILVIVIFLAAFIADVAGQADPVSAKRAALKPLFAVEKLEAQGIENPTNKQWEEANQQAEAELANFSEAELDARFAALEKAVDAAAADDGQPEAGIAGAEQLPVDGPAGNGVAPPAENVQADQPNFIALFFKSMFSPIDGLFILLAFFTAYKVGSGQPTS